jgi:hypothetical protein
VCPIAKTAIEAVGNPILGDPSATRRSRIAAKSLFWNILHISPLNPRFWRKFPS